MRYVIAGPCAIESIDSFVRFADDLVRLFERFPSLELVYKGSFDKANRSRSGSPRGVGLIEAEVAWRMIRDQHPRLKLTTDVHETWQARAVSGLIDVIQIPAMLGRQTDLIAAAAQYAPRVNIKIPVWEDDVVRFTNDTGQYKLPANTLEPWFTYRGTGTRGNLVVDMVQLAEMESLDFPFLDLTHTNRGDRLLSRSLARMAAALPGLGFFAETHPRPSAAVCDAAHQLSEEQLEQVLEIVA